MRGYTKSRYLTVRCHGCECWLHPRAVATHHDRCAGRRWDLDVGQSALVGEEIAGLFTQVLSAELVDRPTLSQDRLLSPGPGEFLQPSVCHGIVVRSPVPAVGARAWTTVATAAARHLGEAGLRRCLSAEGLAGVARELGVEVSTCEVCGEAVNPRRVGSHRATSAVCRWRRAVAEVHSRWALGYRDPWSVPGAPLDWTGLNARVRWRRRLHVVVFPRWAAVLVAPGASQSPTP